MALAQILLIVRPYPINMTTLYIIQIIIPILLITTTHTKNYTLYNLLDHDEPQIQSIHKLRTTLSPNDQQHNITSFNRKTINTMINARNPPSLLNITLYKLFFPDPSKHCPTADTSHPYPLQKQTTTTFHLPKFLYKKIHIYIKNNI